tara:strand:- start:1009 stop:1890 length:882 start_codon:yes stop_codon:yes gene_type:complete
LNSVSTIIPVHKYNQTTREAILSAINQNYEEHKIHVIINSIEKNLINKISTDFGEKIEITKIDDLGVSFARNKGIELSTSDFIAFLDSDDTWYQDKLSRQINYMIENNYSICGTLMDYRTNSYKSKITVGNTSNNQDFIKEARYMPFPISSLIIKSSCLKDDYFFSETLGTEKYGQIEDLEFISRLANKFTITIFPFSTGSYLINDKGATSMEFVKQRSAGHQLSKLRIGGDVNLINDFNFKIKSTNKIKHEKLRLKFITNFIDRRYFKALIYVLFLLFTNPYLTIKKISQQF